MKSSEELYPVFLKLAGKKVLVVGGGAVGERKVKTILECGGKVILVSPEATDELKRLAETGEIQWRRREFREEDTEGIYMAFAATGRREVNSLVAKLCKDKGIMVNVADSLDESDFLVPSFFKKGSISVAVSTAGISPALSRTIRELIEEALDEDFASYAELLENLRRVLKKKLPEEERRELLLFLGSREAFLLFKKEGRKGIEKLLRKRGIGI